MLAPLRSSSTWGTLGFSENVCLLVHLVLEYHLTDKDAGGESYLAHEAESSCRSAFILWENVCLHSDEHSLDTEPALEPATIW